MSDYQVFFDASTRCTEYGGHHGYGAAAIAVYPAGSDQPVLEQVTSRPDLHTVNENEYVGLIRALEAALDLCMLSDRALHIEIIGDSKVVTQQFRGKGDGEPWLDDGTGVPGFQCATPRLRPYLDAARKLYRCIVAAGHRVTVTHICRSTHPGNSRVDYLAQADSDRQATLRGRNAKTRTPVGIPYTPATVAYTEGIAL